MSYNAIKQKIKEKKAKVSIIGLGYVGLPLAAGFAKAGIKTTGIDISNQKIELLEKGKSYIEDIEHSVVRETVKSGNFIPTTDFKKLKNQDIVIICVPTPLRKTREPDLSYIIESSRMVVQSISKNTLIILESTTYPGTTREILLPLFESNGFKQGKDVFLAFSPERVDPGNKDYVIKNTPKVIGGLDNKSLDLAKLIYKTIVDNVVTVNSCEEAEMVKLLENTFRAVNIGLINELAMLCNRFNLDIWNIIRAAATKPYGFMPFYPGPGLGGHCIPVDPQFLSWKAKSHQFYPRFIDYAEEINRSMPGYVVSRLSDFLNKSGKCIKGSKILLSGISYKKNVGDMRESPAIDIIDSLKNMEGLVSYCDPHVKSFKGIKRVPLKSIKYNEYDCVMIITDHDEFDIQKIINKSKAVLDCRGITLGLKGKAIVERI